jgi:hypothetical protein
LANTTGEGNTASGYRTLASNTTGALNTAGGSDALLTNTTGGANTAHGYFALEGNNGDFNIASGAFTLQRNITGNNNTAVGVSALVHSQGSGNIAVGKDSGKNLTGGDNNIYLGHPGVANESDTLRLGDTAVHTRAFIAGVFGTGVAKGKVVHIASDGELGVQISSARYKRDIEAMGTRSRPLITLRPVSFRYKDDPEGVRQYGLIAEEVATVYPELVTRTPKGEVEGVDYEALIPMLLNELQHQQQELAALKAEQESLRNELVKMRAATTTHKVSLGGR